MTKASRRRSRDQPIPPHKAAFSRMAARMRLNQPGNKIDIWIDTKFCDLASLKHQYIAAICRAASREGLGPANQPDRQRW
jgi:hypothetical protein